MTFKTKVKAIFIGLVFLLQPVSAQDMKILENFEDYAFGSMNFSGWYLPKKSLSEEASKVYQVQAAGSEKNKFLQAEIKSKNFIQAFKIKSWKIDKYPCLSWKWRVWNHPEGANPKTKLNDTAAGVYVVFKSGLFSFRSIKYIWAENSEVGYVKESYKAPQVTIRSGGSLGEWQAEKRNVKADFERYLGKSAPSKAVAIGIVSDASSVKKHYAKADFDDFIAMPGKCK